MSEFVAVAQATPWLWLSTCFVFGLIFGSFLNVVIYRWPFMLEKWLPIAVNESGHRSGASAIDAGDFRLKLPGNLIEGSRCPHCESPIAWYHNVPLLSWLALRGRCASCGWAIPSQYIFVETTAGVIALVCGILFGVTLTAVAAMLFGMLTLALYWVSRHNNLRTQSR